MKNVLIYQALVTAVLGGLLLIFSAAQHSYSFVAGATIILISVLLLGISWKLIFQKKLIALAVMIIVFKYAILGIIIFKLMKLPWFEPLWFALGVSSFILSALAYAIQEALSEEKIDGSI